MNSRPKRVRIAPTRLSDEQAAEAIKSARNKPAKKLATVSAVAGGRTEKKWKPAKATNANNSSRGKLLSKELAKYCLERRKDSKLCEAFVKGVANKTAAEVSVIMCRMKYLYEGHCREFEDFITSTEEEIDREVDDLAELEARYKHGTFRYHDGYYPIARLP